MKVSQQTRSTWKYIFLTLMLLAIAGFSLFPLLNSILQQSQSLKESQRASINSASSENLAKLEAEAFGYQLVLEREPENQTALRGLLQVRLEQKDLKGAIEPLEKLTKLNKEQVQYSILLAQAKQQINDLSGAMGVYQTILDSHPGNIEALQGLVNLLLQQNSSQTAIELLQNSLRAAIQANLARPNAVDITSMQLLLAQVYVEQKSYENAIALYDQAINADKEDFRPVLSKALVLQEQGKAIEAQSLFNQALELAPASFKDQIKVMAASGGNDQIKE